MGDNNGRLTTYSITQKGSIFLQKTNIYTDDKPINFVKKSVKKESSEMNSMFMLNKMKTNSQLLGV